MILSSRLQETVAAVRAGSAAEQVAGGGQQPPRHRGPRRLAARWAGPGSGDPARLAAQHRHLSAPTEIANSNGCCPRYCSSVSLCFICPPPLHLPPPLYHPLSLPPPFPPTSFYLMVSVFLNIIFPVGLPKYMVTRRASTVPLSHSLPHSGERERERWKFVLAKNCSIMCIVFRFSTNLDVAFQPL